MAKIKWRGGALIAPLPPVMVTSGDMDISNIMTVGWTGITNTIPPKTYISVRPKRHSYNIIKESGEFVINLTPANTLEVLIVAIARQVIVSHGSAITNIVCVACIGGLFAIRKFLISPSDFKKELSEDEVDLK